MQLSYSGKILHTRDIFPQEGLNRKSEQSTNVCNWTVDREQRVKHRVNLQVTMIACIVNGYGA